MELTRSFAVLCLAGVVMSACATAPPPPPHGGGGPPSAPLVGTEWRLEDLLGGGVIDNSNITLKLAADGSAAGSGGCNRYFGTWKQAGGKLTMGQMGATRMACAPALMNQEDKFLKALEGDSAYAFSADGALVVTTAAGPLTFRKNE